jgi:hypothetical protein
MPQMSQQGNPPNDHSRDRAPGQQRRQFISTGVRVKCRAGVLLMNSPTVVQIVGAPIACKEGVKDSWREVAEWAAGQLKTSFGEAVQVKYYDLFDSDCPTISSEALLPLVLVNGGVLSSGGKISVPAIRRWIEMFGSEVS